MSTFIGAGVHGSVVTFGLGVWLDALSDCFLIWGVIGVSEVWLCFRMFKKSLGEDC